MDEALEGVEKNRRISCVTFSAAMYLRPVRTWTIQKASHQLSSYISETVFQYVSNLSSEQENILATLAG